MASIERSCPSGISSSQLPSLSRKSAFHVLQGVEYYSGKPILYSLGNFWFDGFDIYTVLAEVRICGTAIPVENTQAYTPIKKSRRPRNLRLFHCKTAISLQRVQPADPRRPENT